MGSCWSSCLEAAEDKRARVAEQSLSKLEQPLRQLTESDTGLARRLHAAKLALRALCQEHSAPIEALMRALPTKGVRALDDLPPQLASQLLRAARELKTLSLEHKDVSTQLRMVQDRVSVLQRLRTHSHLRVLSEIDKTFSDEGLSTAVLREDVANAAVSAEETETLSRAVVMPELTPDSSLADTLMQMLGSLSTVPPAPLSLSAGDALPAHIQSSAQGIDHNREQRLVSAVLGD